MEARAIWEQKAVMQQRKTLIAKCCSLALWVRTLHYKRKTPVTLATGTDLTMKGYPRNDGPW